MIHIAALALPGTFMASLAQLTDAFQLTKERGQRTIGGHDGQLLDLRLSVLSADGRDVSIGRLSKLRIDWPIGGGEHFDFIWIPAFHAYGKAALRDRLAANRSTICWLKQAAMSGTVIGASGAAVTLPMAAHLTDGLPIPVAAPLLPVVRALFPRFRHGADLAVADHGSLLLSRGIGQDVLAITAAFARIFSPATGRWIRSVFGSETFQDEALLQGPARDPLVEKARLMLEQRFSTPVSVSDLAAELCVSHAALIRRFRRALNITPSGYLHHLRLGAAQRILLHSDWSVDSVASAVGYGDARLFRQMFRKATGVSATQWRRTERDRASRLLTEPPIAGPAP